MDQEMRDSTRENVMGEYAHAGLGIALGLSLGPLSGLLIGHVALGLALGIALGLLLEVVFELQDSRHKRGKLVLKH